MGETLRSPFQRIVVAVPLYFTVLWLLFAGQSSVVRVGFAVVLLIAGSVAGTLLKRELERRQQQALSELETRVQSRNSFREIVEVYAAEPELPQRQRARFLGSLGHELRNPLNSVTGFSDMLLGGIDGELNSEQRSSVATIRGSAERLLRLVGTVVDQSRLEVGTLRLQQQWVAPTELISEALAFVRTRSGEISVIGGVAEGLPRVFVDRHRTIHALVSLAVLVIRSSETDMVMRVAPPRRDQVGKGFVQFDLMTNLKDSSADTLAVVERLEKASPRSDALGLEVSVARSVLEAQGGRIWTEAGTAGSLRVCVTLPTSST